KGPLFWGPAPGSAAATARDAAVGHAGAGRTRAHRGAFALGVAVGLVPGLVDALSKEGRGQTLFGELLGEAARAALSVGAHAVGRALARLVDAGADTGGGVSLVGAVGLASE